MLPNNIADEFKAPPIPENPVTVKQLTIGEVAYFEDITGVRMVTLEDEDISAKVMGAMAGLVLYRTGMYPTPADAQEAAKKIPLGDIDKYISMRDDAPAPVEPGLEEPSAPAA